MICDNNILYITTVRDENRLIGCCFVVISPYLICKDVNLAETDFIFILEEYRGKGIGRTLIKKVLDTLKNKKVLSFSLTDNPLIPLNNLLLDLNFLKLGTKYSMEVQSCLNG